MKKFTVKDFLKLNSPCYGCGKDINVRVGIDIKNSHAPPVFLAMSVASAKYSVPLVITYHDSLKLSIEPRTNKFIVSNAEKFASFIKGRNIFLETNCSECQTYMVSQYLEFNTTIGFIKPVGIVTRYLILRDKNNKYVIHSDFVTEKSSINIFAIKDGAVTSFSDMKLPLLPHYQFRDQTHFMSKIKTYMLFS